MIERYIYDVTRRLPETERGEVKRELKACINDMLPDNPEDQDIINVLTKLGAPRMLAEQYRQKPRYLISPAMFGLYISTLKTVIAIVASICACVGMLTVVSSGSIGEILGAAISSAAGGALQAALWVTLAFAIIEHYGLKVDLKPWSVDDLPQLPDPRGVEIPRLSSIVGIIVSVFFIAVLIMSTVRGESFFMLVRDTDIINPFSQSTLERCIPYLLLLGFMSLTMNGLKLYWARWNPQLCIINLVYNLVWISIVLYILRWPNLFSGEFISFVTTVAGGADIPWNKILIFISAIFVLVSAIDIGISAWNTWKGMRADKSPDECISK